jgi:hypothetical protein
MVRPKSAPVGPTFFKRRDAEFAAKVLREKKVAAEVVEVSMLLCPGAVRKRGYELFVPRDDVRRTAKLLVESPSRKVRQS